MSGDCMEKQVLWTKEFLGMSLSSFFQYMVHYALIAALPVFVLEGLAGTDWQAGLVMTFFQMGAVLCRPFAGKWIDEYSKTKMLVITLSALLVVSAAYSVAQNCGVLLVIRLLHGAVFAIGTTTVAAIAAIVAPAQRKGEGIGYFAMFSNLAMVIGPFFSLTLITHASFSVLFGGCLVLALLAFICGTGGYAGQKRERGVATPRTPLSWTAVFEVNALPIALLGGLVFFSYAGVLLFISLYAKQLQLAAYTSEFFALFAFTMVATRPFVGRWFDRLGASAVVYPGTGLFVLGLLGLSQVQELTGFLAASIVIGAGFGALSPVLQTLAIQVSPRQRAGVATSTYFLSLDIAVGLGSFFLSLVAAYAGYRNMYIVTAVVVAVTALVYYVLCQRKLVVVQSS